MSKSIHGHEVIDILASAGKCLEKKELIAAAGEKFGEDAVFHACAVEGLSVEALIDFLIGKGKFIESDEGLTMSETHSCQ